VDLVGNVVRLRAPRPEDAEAVMKCLAEPEVVHYLSSWAWAPYGPSDARDWIERKAANTVRWAIESLADHEFVGATGFNDVDLRNRHAEWGIWIGPPARWGKGFGTEACQLAMRYAFHEVGLEKVYLYVYEGNDRGLRAYEKAGFKVEGTFPRHTWFHGGWVAARVMAVYRDHPLYAPIP
jgi:RimJ/RimL family protein N-acetyltransferase